MAMEEQTAGSCEQKIDAIRRAISSKGSLVVGLSSGVDSALLAYLASSALGANAIAVTAVSPAVAQEDIAEARKNALEIGIRHVIVETHELEDEKYLKNDGKRCFYCRHELSEQLLEIAKREGMAAAAIGINADDLSDYRPGIAAARELGIWMPLMEFGLTKAEIRQEAARVGLKASSRPSNACLSSRIQYGQHIDTELLKRVEKAEDGLHALGFTQCRVRVHGAVARIEIPVAEIPLLIDEEMRKRVVEVVSSSGFLFVTLDLAGFRSGSMNALLRNTP
ncbi:MAG: ATP-dependent sacrificial sulfur transferase LarE [Methanomassiliicoccales archaeon]